MDALTARRGSLAAVSVLLFAAGVLLGRRAAPAPATAPHAPSRPAADSGHEAPPAPVGSSSFRDALLRLDPGPAPAGDGEIRGRVTREDGRPLAGVTLRALPDLTGDVPVLDAPPAPGDPERPEIEAEVRYYLLRRAGRKDAVSGADGRYRVTGLGAVPYYVRAYREGWTIRPAGESTVRPGGIVDFVARPAVVVSVEVLAPDGRRAERARVRVRPSRYYAEANRTWTPEFTMIAVPPGPARIRAFGGREGTLASDEVERVFVEGERPAPVVLRLKERAGIEGTLHFPPIPLRGSPPYRIAALRIREGGPDDPALLRRFRHAEGRMNSYRPRLGIGQFLLPDLPPGLYLVGALDGGGNVCASARVRVGTGTAQVDLEIPRSGDEGETTVRILGPDGSELPESGTRVDARHVGGDGRTGPPEAGVRRSGGGYAVPIPASGSDEGGRYLLRVVARNFGERTVEYDPRSQAEVTVRFEAPAHLTVRIPDYPGGRYEAATRVRLAPVRPGEPRLLASPTEKRPNGRGRTGFGPLSPGEYEISLSVDVDIYGREVVRTRTVELSSGEQEVALDPPPLYTLEIAAEGGETSWRLESVASGRWRRAVVREGGAARFERVLAGDYVLWQEGAGRPRGTALHVDGDRRIDFRATPLDALRVCLRSGDGLLAKAGLRDGDLLVAIADRAIGGTEDALLLPSLHADDGPVRITVRRGATTTTASLDFGAIMDPARAGGTLVPWTR